MKPGDLRRWLDNEDQVDALFLLLERTRLRAAGGEMLDGWHILEEDVLKSVYHDVIIHYSEAVSETR